MVLGWISSTLHYEIKTLLRIHFGYRNFFLYTGIIGKLSFGYSLLWGIYENIYGLSYVSKMEKVLLIQINLVYSQIE